MKQPEYQGKWWALHNSDCIEGMHAMPAQSVDCMVTSIPFGDLFVYSDSERDLGNAGEGGKFGDEEARIIAPAIAALQAEGIAAFGPVPGDALFTPRARTGYDAALCMYHDQALIPLKALEFDAGVNVTLGLPIIRTSPDHGTAFDIAGQGLADPGAMAAAIVMAAEMAVARANAGA